MDSVAPHKTPHSLIFVSWRLSFVLVVGEIRQDGLLDTAYDFALVSGFQLFGTTGPCRGDSKSAQF